MVLLLALTGLAIVMGYWASWHSRRALRPSRLVIQEEPDPQD